MQLEDFRKWIESQPDLQILGAILGESPSDDVVAIEHVPTKRQFDIAVHCEERDPLGLDTPALAIDSLTDENKDQVLAVLRSERGCGVLIHQARIVGYYAIARARGFINWNRSKIAELRDRRKGDYALGSVGSLDPASSTVA